MKKKLFTPFISLALTTAIAVPVTTFAGDQTDEYSNESIAIPYDSSKNNEEINSQPEAELDGNSEELNNDTEDSDSEIDESETSNDTLQELSNTEDSPKSSIKADHKLLEKETDTALLPDGSVSIEKAFPDDAFREYVENYIDKDKDGKLSPEEIYNTRQIHLNGLPVASLEGVEYLDRLHSISVVSTEITSIDTSKNKGLKFLDVTNTGITSIDIKDNELMEELIVEDTAISSIDVSENSKLLTLNIASTNITEFDVTSNTALKKLVINKTKVTSIDVSKNLRLERLYVSGSAVTSLNLSNNENLKELYIPNTAISSIDLSNNKLLRIIDISDTNITEFKGAGCPELERLTAVRTKIKSVDLSKNLALEYVDLSNSDITSIDVENNENLEELFISGTGVKTIDVSKNKLLDTLNVSGTKITSLNLKSNKELLHLTIRNIKIDNIDLSENNKLRNIYVDLENMNDSILNTYTPTNIKKSRTARLHVYIKLDKNNQVSLSDMGILTPSQDELDNSDITSYISDGKWIVSDADEADSFNRMVNDCNIEILFKYSLYLDNVINGELIPRFNEILELANLEKMDINNIMYDDIDFDSLPADIGNSIFILRELIEYAEESYSENAEEIDRLVAEFNNIWAIAPSVSDATYDKASDKDVVMKSDTSVILFKGVRVDGTEISSDNYTVTEGSTIVTFNKAYLDTLTVGGHAVEFIYDGGISKGNLTVSDSKVVKPSDKPESPESGITSDESEIKDTSTAVKTGDSVNNSIWYTILSAVGITGLIAILKRKKRV